MHLSAFSLRPGLEFPDGFTLYRQLDMGVEGIDFLARGMAHESHSHVLDHARLHEPGVERVAKIVKTEIADARPANRRLPSRLDPVNRAAFEGENQPVRLCGSNARKEPGEAVGKWNLTGFATSGLRVRNREHPTVEVDVLAALREELPPPHAGIERCHNDLLQMRCRRGKDLPFLGETEDWSRLAPRPREPDTHQRICGKETFVNRPVEEVAKRFDIAVESGFGQRRFLPPPRSPIFPDRRLRDGPDGPLAEIR